MKDAFSVSEENDYTPRVEIKVDDNMDFNSNAEGGASESTRNHIAETAVSGIGGEYVWGGATWKAWDCSGFVQQVYKSAGISIPRVHQWLAANPVKEPQLGDLVVQNGGSHVGIFIGQDEMVSAMNPTQGTIRHPIDWMSIDGYYTFL